MPNYVIAGFDADAFAFCRRQVLPCFPVSPEVAAKADEIFQRGDGAEPQQRAKAEQAAPEAKAAETAAAAVGGSGSPRHGAGTAPGPAGAESKAQAFGTQGFRALTKLKSQQVLRILEFGYNVMWSDVDIFWKVDPIPGVLAEMQADGMDADIGIQSNAPPSEAAENGHRRINSGFYFAKSNPAAVDAFRQIVDHARQSKLSEQPSFYTVLCGDDKQYVQGSRACANTAIPVSTRFLSRDIYPNGAMVDVVRGVTPASGTASRSCTSTGWRATTPRSSPSSTPPCGCSTPARAPACGTAPTAAPTARSWRRPRRWRRQPRTRRRRRRHREKEPKQQPHQPQQRQPSAPRAAASDDKGVGRRLSLRREGQRSHDS